MTTPSPTRDVLSRATPSKKLSRDELEKAVERLSRAPTPSVVLEPIPQVINHPKLTAEQLAESAARMCNGAVEAKHQSVAALEQRFLVDKRPKSVMSYEERDASVARLYNGSVKAAETKLEALKKQYLHKGVVAPKDKTMVDHSIQHLFYEEKERNAQRRKSLHEKYVAPTGPKVKKIDPASVAKLVERLGTVAGK